MTGTLRRLLGTSFGLVWVAAFAVPAFSQSVFNVYPQAQSDYLPGTFVVLANPTTGANYLATITDPIFGTTQTGYSYASVLDTGSSGSVICATEAVGRNLPKTGDTFSDQGIGGTESFYVSQPTTIKLASVDSGAVVVSWDGTSVTEHLDMFNAVGTTKLQIRQSDPSLDLGFGITSTIMVNTIGTPLLNQYVMHVKSGSPAYAWQMDSFGAAPVNYVPSELASKAALPSNLNLGSSELVLVPKVGGTTSTLHVPLVYKNFIDNPNPAPSVSTNPTIPGVVATLGTKSAASDWLFDSGAAVTMMGRNMAASLGIDLNQAGVTSTTVLGIGGTVTFQGYELDQVALSAANGGKIDFHDVVVFVPSEGALPADLPGIFGMNLINNSFSGVSGDIFGGITELNPVSSFFSDWYVVPGAAAAAAAWQGGDSSGPTKWEVAANWSSNSGVPNQAGITVSFGNQPAGNSLIDIGSGGKTVGNLVFLSTTSTTIQSSGGYGLTLDNSGQVSGIDVSGSHTIAVPVTLNNDAQITGAGTLTLSAAVGGAHDLRILGNVVASNLQVASLSVESGAKLTFSSTAGSTYAGTIRGTGTLTKAGAGTFTLNGASSFTGATVVAQGTLQLGLAAQSTVLAGMSADIQNDRSKLVFDYSGGSSPAAAVLAELTKSFNGGTHLWSAANGGKIFSSTAAGTPLSRTLGWRDDGISQVTVMQTLWGDANLDGKVDFADLGLVTGNYGTHGGWAQGDFNYDGVINFADLGYVTGNYGTSLPKGGSTPNVVPEPGTLALLAAGLIGLLAYVWKKRT